MTELFLKLILVSLLLFTTCGTVVGICADFEESGGKLNTPVRIIMKVAVFGFVACAAVGVLSTVGLIITY